MTATHFIEVYQHSDGRVKQSDYVLPIKFLPDAIETSKAWGIKTIAILKFKRRP